MASWFLFSSSLAGTVKSDVMQPVQNSTSVYFPVTLLTGSVAQVEVWPESLEHETLDDLEVERVSSYEGEVERTVALLVEVVHIRAMTEQLLYTLELPMTYTLMERGLTCSNKGNSDYLSST